MPNGQMFTFRHILVVTLCTILLFSPVGLLAQQVVKPGQFTKSADVIVKKGRLNTTDGIKLTFSTLTGTESAFTYIPSNASTETSISSDKVLRIEKQTGTEAGKWALMLGLSCMAGATLGVIQAANSPDATSSGTKVGADVAIPIVAGLTAVGALLGLAIGSGHKKYEVVYKNPDYSK